MSAYRTAKSMKQFAERMGGRIVSADQSARAIFPPGPDSRAQANSFANQLRKRGFAGESTNAAESEAGWAVEWPL